MKLIFELVAQDVNVSTELAKQRDALKALNKELKKVDEGTEAQKELTAQAVKTKLAINDLTEQQKKLNSELKALKVPADSLAGLRLQYSKLAVEISKLSEAERGSSFGQGLIKNAAKIKKEIDGIEQSIGRFTGNVGNYRSAFDGIAAGFGKISAAFAILQGGNAIVDATRETEKLFAVLNQSVGNENASLKIFEQIKTFALETPFQVNEIVESFVKLEQRNFKPTIDQLRVLGDIASSQGKSINQFVEAILDAQTGEFERLKEFGIIAKKNGDQLQLSFKGQTTTIKNTSEEISKYLLSLGKLPSVSGAASAVAKTLDGSISNLLDNFTQLAAGIGGAGGILKSFVDAVSSGISSLNEFISVPLSEKLEEQRGEFNALVGVLKDVNASEGTRNRAIGELQKNYPDYIGNINLQNASEAELNTVLEQGNALFLKRIFIQTQEEELSKLARKRLDLEKSIFDIEKKRQALGSSAGGFANNNTLGSTGLASLQTKGQPLENALNDQRKALEQLNKETQDFTKNQDELAVKLFGSSEAAAKAKKEYDNLRGFDKSGAGGKSGGGIAKEADAAAGSIDFLEEKVSKLKASLEAATPDQIPKILGNLTQAEKELKNLQDSIDRLKATPQTEQQVIAAGEQQAATELGAPTDAKAKELTDAKREAAVKFSQFDIETTAETEEIKNQLIKAANQKKIELTEEEVKERLKIEEEAEKKKQEIRDAFVNAAFDSAIALTQSIADEQTKKVDEDKDKELTALDEEYEKKKELAQGNAQALEAIDKEYAAKKDEIEKEAARERKRIALIESIIAGALATVKALPNVPLVIATGIGAAIQSAIIARQKFAFGGFTGKGQRVDETGERVVNAQLHEGEYVAPRSQVQMYPSLFNALDRMRTKRGASTGTGFATGGFSTAPGISLSTSQSRAQSGLNIEAKAVIDKESVYFIAEQVAKETYSAIAQGLNDADRTNERKQKLGQLTEV